MSLEKEYVTSVFVKRNFGSDILVYFLCASITITFFYNSISIPFFHAIPPPVTKSAVIMSLQPVPISTVTWLLAYHFTWIPAQSHAFDPSLAWLTPYCLTLNYVYSVAMHLLGAGNEPMGCYRLDAAFFYLNVPLLTQASSEVLRKIRVQKLALSQLITRKKFHSLYKFILPDSFKDVKMVQRIQKSGKGRGRKMKSTLGRIWRPSFSWQNYFNGIFLDTDSINDINI